MEESRDSRKASGAIVGLALTLLVGLIIVLGSGGALAAPSSGGGDGTHIGIVR